MGKQDLYKQYVEIQKSISELQPEGEWDEDLIGCPSQLYLDVKSPSGQEYTLYLRWRWNDPWTFDVLLETDAEGRNTLFHPVEDFPFFTEDNYKKAEAFAELWWECKKDKIDEQLFS